jgi:hypothetical protein
MSTNLPKMSKRAAQALDVLADGGRFRYGLERNSYTGREQFQWRLEHARGGRVHGVGGAAYRELCSKGFAFRSEAAGFTGIATYYYLKAGV